MWTVQLYIQTCAHTKQCATSSTHSFLICLWLSWLLSYNTIQKHTWPPCSPACRNLENIDLCHMQSASFRYELLSKTLCKHTTKQKQAWLKTTEWAPQRLCILPRDTDSGPLQFMWWVEGSGFSDKHGLNTESLTRICFSSEFLHLKKILHLKNNLWIAYRLFNSICAIHYFRVFSLTGLLLYFESNNYLSKWFLYYCNSMLAIKSYGLWAMLITEEIKNLELI